jgi:tetratricopeptide (TPR) repeat protein
VAGFTYGICGETARARQKLEELHALSRERYVDPSIYADIHIGLGELDEALAWYEKAYEDRTPNMAYAAIAPLISPRLAANPRYEALVRRMGSRSRS